jgi:WD40 repeat protein
MRRWATISLLCGLTVATSTGWAAKVKVWHHTIPSHYDKARMRGTVVSSEGAVHLARQLKPLVALDATHVWDVVEDKSGNLLVATGDEGKIYRVTPDGQITIAFDSQDSQVLCLALAADGSVYAGTGPNGLIIRIAPNGAGQVLSTIPDSYVWSLAIDPDMQALYAGTGPHGKIYQINGQGKSSVYYATKQDHVLCLAFGPNGSLYAGTDKNGLVYRLEGPNKAFVVFHAPQAEVRTLAVTRDAVYVGTSSPRQRFGHASSSRSESASNIEPPAALETARTSESKSTMAGAHVSGHEESSEHEEHGGSTSAPPTPSSGENSLYRIAGDGTTRELFRDKVMILSVLRQGGRAFVGTGMEGQLFEVDEANKERSEIARLDHGQVQCLARRHDGTVVVGTGDPGKLYLLQDRFVARGTLTSEVLDAKMISRWGSLRWKADSPPGTKVTLAVRSGNLSDPDETWSDWSGEQSDGDQAQAAAPPARFLQYRVTMSTEDTAASPQLRWVSVRYMTMNQAPEVTAIDVPDLDSSTQDSPKKLKFHWTATDPNEDDLTYNLYIRKEGWKDWVLMEENIEHRDYEWDTTTTPSGMYQLKVVASDRKDNPEEQALTGERVTGFFPVTHTPPVVNLKVAGVEDGQATIDATASDPMVRLISASFAINGKTWVNIFPSDGLFDSKTEHFRFKTGPLKAGSYILVMRVRDAAGNTGSGDLMFSVKPTDEARAAK